MSPSSRVPARPLPVLFLVPHLGRGGAERQLTELVTRMDRSRFTPVVVCQKGGGPFFDEIAGAGVEAHRLDTGDRLDPRFPWRLARLCRKRGIRAMVLRDFSTGMVGRLVGRALGIHPILMAEHTTGRFGHDPKKRPLERLFAPLVDGVIAVAQGQVPFLVDDKGYAADRVRVIHNGIDLASWTPRDPDPEILRELSIPESAPVVGMLAMLRQEKDHDTFLAAARIVTESLPDTRYVLVGDGTERERLTRRVDELGLAGSVVFTGARTDVPRLLSTFDVSVLSSRREAFPMSFLEAMAMERPVIGTRVGGLPELVEEGENGFLVDVGKPEQLAEAIRRVVADRAVARRMGKASRRLVEEKFTVERMVDATEQFLDSFFAEAESENGQAGSPDRAKIGT